MKTVDLIPFILLELDDSDKYGFEMTKNIESKSNGKIVIKQPTLYTLLKKLEKSKFISSYWEDSEIGGKRHYYRLTENGRMQVATLPAYSFLLSNALNDEQEPQQNSQITHTPSTKESTHLSIMHELLNQSSQPVESVLPSEEVFSDNNIDTKTDLGINLENSSILKDQSSSIDEKFAENKDVIKFTEKVNINSVPPLTTALVNNSKDLLDVSFTAPQQDINVKFVDYVDMKQNKEYLYSKQIGRRKILATFITSLSIIAMALLCQFITKFTGRSALYYTFFIASILIAIFYPTICMVRIESFKCKHQCATYNIKIKQRFLIGLSISLTALILCLVINLCVEKNTIASIFNFANFANLYAPVLLCLTYFVDILTHSILVAKLKI